MKLSKNFNRILKLSENYVFHANAAPATFEFANPSFAFPITRINVYMQGIKPSFVGSSLSPLLKSVAAQPTADVKQRPQLVPRCYIPLEKNEFESITIYILDEFGESVSFDHQPVRLQLHFRPKKAIFNK